MKNFLKVLCLFLGIKVKEKEDLNPGVLGYYDCKPYHNFHFALNYARNIEVSSGKVIDDGTKSVVVGMAMPGLQESLGLSKNDVENT